MWLQGAFKSMKALVAMEIHWQHNGNTVCRKDNCKTHQEKYDGNNICQLHPSCIMVIAPLGYRWLSSKLDHLHN